MAETDKPSKPRELLPDVESHLNEMDRLQDELGSVLLPFESMWAHLLLSDETAKSLSPNKEDPTPIMRIYAKMKTNEIGFQELINRLKKTQQNYLGVR